MLKLEIIVVSTRPGRRGKPVADWFEAVARNHGKFDVNVADLAEINLPLLDEPNEADGQNYTKEHSKAWSARINAADAFVFVTPEYNHTTPPTLSNAVNFLYPEWHYKPVGFVSYGGIAAGTRSVQATKLLVTTVQMMPLKQEVNIPFITERVKDGVFQAEERNVKAANGMLDELVKFAEALRVLR